MKNIEKFNRKVKEKYIEFIIEYGKYYVKSHYECFGKKDKFEYVFNGLFDNWVLSDNELDRIKQEIMKSISDIK